MRRVPVATMQAEGSTCCSACAGGHDGRAAIRRRQLPISAAGFGGATGGSGPYTFNVTTGTLPTGLTLSNGVIGGIPTVAGTSPITITVTDSARGDSDRQHIDRHPAPQALDLLLLSGSVSFGLTTGSVGLPSAQTVAGAIDECQPDPGVHDCDDDRCVVERCERRCDASRRS